MPEMTITIGGRDFPMSCQPGEEGSLQSAAGMLDSEAQALLAQIGMIPEPRMLLMAGLMVADRAAGLQEKIRLLEERLSEAEAKVRRAETEIEAAAANPTEIEVPTVPEELHASLSALAEEAEALADRVEDQEL